MTQADDAILTKLSEYILDPEIVEGAIVDAVRELRPSRDVTEARRVALLAEIRKLEIEQERYVAAIAATGKVEALARALTENEQRLGVLRRELGTLEGVEHFAQFDLKRIERDLRKRLTEWRAMLKRQTPLARQVVTRLLDGRVEWTPRPAERLYEFAGRARFDKLLSGIVFTRGMASPPRPDRLDLEGPLALSASKECVDYLADR